MDAPLDWRTMEFVGRHLDLRKEVGGRQVWAQLYRYPSSVEVPDRNYALVVKTSSNAYRLIGIHPSDVDEIFARAPMPDDASDQSTSRAYVQRRNPDFSATEPDAPPTWTVEVFVRPMQRFSGFEDCEGAAIGKYYRLEDFGTGPAQDLGRELPEITYVAIDTTDAWRDDIAAECGPIFAVYAGDIEAVSNFYPGIKPLAFQKNVFGRLPDTAEARDALAARFGYGSFTEMEGDDGTDPGYPADIELSASQVRSNPMKEAIDPGDAWIDEYMLDATEEYREQMVQELLAEYQANGRVYEPTITAPAASASVSAAR